MHCRDEEIQAFLNSPSKEIFFSTSKDTSSTSTMLKTHHTRSVSLPSSLHPVLARFEVLSRQKTSEEESSSSIRKSLSQLQSLKEYFDDLILMPENQQALKRAYNEKQTDEIFYGTLMALDVCEAAKNSLLQAKDHTQELQSIIRRWVGEASLAKEIREYITKRRNARKSVHKAFRNSSSMHNMIKVNETSVSIVSILKRADLATISVLETLLSFLSGAKRPFPTKWSLISKLIPSTRIACEEPSENELSKMDTMLQSLVSQKTINSLEIQNLRTQLTEQAHIIQDLEEEVESLFRRLIRTRVSLLNTLNH